MRSIRTFRVAVSVVVAGLGIGGAGFLDAQSLREHTREVPAPDVRATVTQDLIAQRAQLERLIAARNWDSARFARTQAALDRIIDGDGLWVPQRAQGASEAPSGGAADECEFEGLPAPCATEAELDEAIEFLDELIEEAEFLDSMIQADWADWEFYCSQTPGCWDNLALDCSGSDGVVDGAGAGELRENLPRCIDKWMAYAGTLTGFLGGIVGTKADSPQPQPGR